MSSSQTTKVNSSTTFLGCSFLNCMYLDDIDTPMTAPCPINNPETESPVKEPATALPSGRDGAFDQRGKGPPVISASPKNLRNITSMTSGRLSSSGKENMGIFVPRQQFSSSPTEMGNKSQSTVPFAPNLIQSGDPMVLDENWGFA